MTNAAITRAAAINGLFTSLSMDRYPASALGQDVKMNDEPTRPAKPPRYKLALVTWLGVYPTLTVILALLGPAMETWPLPLRTLLVSVVMVVVLSWLILPLLTRVLQGWMSRSD